MKTAIILIIATIASGAVFLKVWSGAPAYEQRRSAEREHRRLGTEYGVARTQAMSIVNNNLEDPVSAVEADLERRPQELAERWGVGPVLWSAAGGVVWGSGDDVLAAEMWGRAADLMASPIPPEARRWGVVRQLGGARALLEVGRVEEARVLAEHAQREIDSRRDDDLRDRTVGMLYEMGWVWKGLGEDGRAVAAWSRHYDWLREHLWTQERNPMLYNRACYANLAGRKDEALALLEEAVKEWPGDVRRVHFTLRLLDADPDLDSLRGEARFIAARDELARRVAERQARAAAEREAAAMPQMGDPSFEGPPDPRPDPVP